VRDTVQRGSQSVTGRTPVRDIVEVETEAAASEIQAGTIAEVLMRDRVSPPTQFLEPHLT
jgi:hypothetical protein